MIADYYIWAQDYARAWLLSGLQPRRAPWPGSLFLLKNVWNPSDPRSLNLLKPHKPQTLNPLTKSQTKVSNTEVRISEGIPVGQGPG